MDSNKERSLTSRNFFGGLIGGLLGILSFALIAPIALPFGCLVGVVVGFWWQELGTLVAKAPRQRKKMRIKKPEEHPTVIGYRRLRMAWWSAGLLYSSLVIFFTINWFGVEAVLGSLMVILFGCLGIGMRSDGLELSEKKDGLKAYYSVYSLHDRWGKLLFFREFAVALGCTFLGPVVMAVALVVFVTGAITIGIPAFSIAVIGYLLRGIHDLTFSRGHWLCVFVTIVTTSFVAFLMRDHMHGATLWVAALMAGAMSGVLSVLVQKTVRHCLNILPRAKEFMQNGGYLVQDPFDAVDYVRIVLFSPPRHQYGVWGWRAARS